MDIPYGKLAIYLLTFLGYIYSGYGSGLLSNLRDAVLTAETLFGGVLQNVVTVAKRFRNLHDVFDAAVDEHCIFQCANGAAPRPDRNHKPSANGCGSLGLNIDSAYLPIGEMQKCCDSHDICYDTCNSDKEVCDMEFKRCLYRYCDSYENSVVPSVVGVGGPTIVKACKGAAKMLFTGTLTLGCKSYMDAQKKACFCPSYGWKDKKNYKYAKGTGEL